MHTPRIGYLTSFANSTLDGAFLQGLADHSYVEGQNIQIERRQSEGNADRAVANVAELIAMPVDVLVVVRDLPARQAARDSTSTVPIVVLGLGDAVGEGWVPSLALPDRNITGVSSIVPQLSGKRLELLKESMPSLTRIGMFWDANASTNQIVWQETEAAAGVLGLSLQSLSIQSAEEFGRSAELMLQNRTEALIIPTGTLVNGVLGRRIRELAQTHQLPTMWAAADSVRSNSGLMSYGTSFAWIYRRGAYYVDRILKGTKPADLPVEQPREFEFVVNLKTARALGLTLPYHILIQVTEVIE